MKRRTSSGAAAVEFAIVAPVFVALLLLALEVGWQMVIETALGAGARAGSRFGTTGTVVAPGISPAPTDRNDSILQLAIRNSGGLMLASRLQIAKSTYASFAAITGGGPPAQGAGGASQVVKYTFTYTQPYLTPIATAITGNLQLVHTVHVTVLNEPFPSN